MNWRDARKDPPTVPGFYRVLHPVYGECEYGWDSGGAKGWKGKERRGWGSNPPDKWRES